MSTTRRSYLSIHPALESVRVYREQIRGYSAEELEDVYYHIDVLREPLRYRIVQGEMERRRLIPCPDSTASAVPREWIERAPGMRRLPVVRAAYMGLLLFLLTSLATGAILLSVWALAVPLGFVGVQASLVYLVLVPAAAAVGLGIGLRAGGWRLRSLASACGVVTCLWLFHRAGGYDAIIKPFFQVGGGGGGFMGGW